MQKSILITGASGNLGHAVVHKFVQADFKVYGTDRSGASMEGAEIASVDLTNEAAVNAYIEQIISKDQQLNAAVLLVGGYTPGNLLATDGAALQKMYKLNFETAYFVVHALLPHFEANGGGHIVLIGSRAAIDAQAALYNVAYGLSKSMVVALGNIINAYGKDKGIRASVIVPSIIDTPPNRANMPDADYSKWTTAEAIADNIHFLFTDAGRHLRETVLKIYNEA
jgi:NAD(P)-dependent dehydrogenase (short-subunit alcohol dehydrogenase family)